MSAWVIETMLASTVLMALVLLLRGPVAQTFGPRIAYLLWLLPALRMVMPPLPDTMGLGAMSPFAVAVEFQEVTADAGPAAAPGLFSTLPWAEMLVALWLGGAVIHFGMHWRAYRRFVRTALAQATELPEYDAGMIEVCASDAVDGPFAAGIVHPLIVLPHDFRTRYSGEELALAMQHERVHHERGDLSFNLAALAMLSLHWFNPIAHRAWRAFRVDQELACDAVVLDGVNDTQRHSYGLALVKSACRRTPIAACALNPRDQLKGRLRMMRKPLQAGKAARLGVFALITAGLGLTASGGIAAEQVEVVREQIVESAPVQPRAKIEAEAVRKKDSWKPATNAPPPLRTWQPERPPVARPVPAGTHEHPNWDIPSATAAPPGVPAAPDSHAVTTEDHRSEWHVQASYSEDGGRGSAFAARQSSGNSLCSNATLGSALVSIEGDSERATVRVVQCISGKDRSAAIRARRDSLAQARKAIAQSAGLSEAARNRALARIDQQLAGQQVIELN